MPDLLDANIWISLSAPDHVHYKRARQYWDEEADRELFFCRITALALLRYLTNAKVLGNKAMGSAEAWQALHTWLKDPSVRYAHEPSGLDDWLGRWSLEKIIRSAAWTDTYLAAFAAAGRFRLVTFDSDFRNYPEIQTLYLGNKV